MHTDSSHPRWWIPAALCILAAIFCFTITTNTGDAAYYVHNIQSAVRSGAPELMLEPGHLLWRPLGYCLSPVVRAVSGLGDFAATFTALAALSYAGTALCLVIFIRMAWRLSGSRLAWVAALALTVVNGALPYAQSGVPYIVGEALLAASLYVTIRAAERGQARWRDSILAGSLLASSLLLWFVYITVTPGVAAAALLWDSKSLNPKSEAFRQGCRRALQLALVTALITGLAYGLAAYGSGVRSVGEFRSWFSAADHGMKGSGSVVKLVYAFPQTFLSLGDGNIQFKRFLAHDSYAPVSFARLWLSGLLPRIAVFYAALGLAALLLARSRAGRLILVTGVAASAGLAYFALFLFDATSVERFLPLLPFAVIGVAYLLRPETGMRVHYAVVAFLVFLLAANVWPERGYVVSQVEAATAARLAPIRASLTEGSSIWVLNTSDQCWWFSQSRMLHPYNRPEPVPVQAFPAFGDSEPWRAFAAAVQTDLRNGKAVWISNRMLAPAPKPEWAWVEGATQGLSWKRLAAYWTQYEFAESTPGEDGFSRVSASPRNFELMQAERH